MSLAATPSTVLAAGLFPVPPTRVAPGAVVAVAAPLSDYWQQSPREKLEVCTVGRAAQSDLERAGHIGTLAVARDNFHSPASCPVNGCDP